MVLGEGTAVGKEGETPFRRPGERVLDVVLVPGELPEKEVRGRTCVLIDVLRATTTLTTAFAHGCQAVLPTLTPEEARELAAAYPGALLAGERGGRKIPGFALGNSPREYTVATVRGKILIFTTTNGTFMLRAAATAGAGRILLASFLNAPAVTRLLAGERGDIFFLCAGRYRQFSLEDTVLAGLLLEGILAAAPVTLTDAAQMARILYRSFADDLLGMLRLSQHGRYLEEIGLGEDLAPAARVGGVELIPEYRDGKIVPSENGCSATGGGATTDEIGSKTALSGSGE